MNLVKFLCIFLLLKYGNCARILAVAPYPVYSHQITFRPLWNELSLRGHQVTVLTTDPVNNRSLINLTEIDLHFSYDIAEKYKPVETAIDGNHSSFEVIDIMIRAMMELTDKQLNSSKVQELINNKNIHFDLAIVEINILSMIPFSWKFNCPWIGITSMDAPFFFHSIAGNRVNAVTNPSYNLRVEDPENLGFTDRLQSLMYSLVTNYYLYFKVMPEEYKIYTKYFGNDLPPLIDIMNNISMLFINTNPIFYNKRTVNPNTVLIGDGIHIQPPKPLPQELKQYLDNAIEGVIYFSLGTNIKSHFIKEETIQAIISAFSELPYKILWKFEKQQINNLPSNVKIEKWVQQQDVLRHPNVKLFIMQGGLQSLQEAVTNYVPVIGIPFYGDQFQNVARMVKNGYGIGLDREKITKESMKEAIIEILNNSKYRETAKKLGKLLQDEPMTGLQKAVWWTEYVLRHNGVTHFKNKIIDVPFYQYYLLDVVGFVFIIISVLFYIIFKLIKYVINWILKPLGLVKGKTKQKIS